MVPESLIMKDGVVQQIDTPHNLYNKPQNLFVAGFIGSPQMNFMDAKIAVNGETVTAQVGDANITVPAGKAKALIEGGYDRQDRSSQVSVRRISMIPRCSLKHHQTA